MAGSLVSGFELKFLPLTQPTVKWKVAMFARRRTSLSPAVESFLDFTLDFAPGWTANGIENRPAERGKRA
jgi:DNA-binding transcriptional LysR family regulator